MQTIFDPIIKYSITCIQRPLKESNGSGLLQQVVLKCRFYQIDLRRNAVSEQWSLTAGGLLIQVASNTDLTVLSQAFTEQHHLCQQNLVHEKGFYERYP